MTSPAAIRQRRYRQRQREGVVVTPVEIDVNDLLAFESAGLLENDDASHLSKAIRVILDEWCRQSEIIGCSCDTLFVGRKSGPE